MDRTVTESILELTRERDVESLDATLVSVLAGSVPVHSISLYKRPERIRPGFIEQTVRMTTARDGTESESGIIHDRELVPVDNHIEACLKAESAFTHRSANGAVRLLIPIMKENRTAAVTVLEGGETLLEQQELIETFTEIYGNYWTILDESERDKLTGLLNRRTYDKKLNKLLQAQKALQSKLKDSHIPEHRQRVAGPNAWLAVLDIDNFKTINDTYGHLFGDEVILMLSQKMKTSFRHTDLLFRFGGDEFVIVLEPIPPEMAALTLGRFLKAVVDHKFSRIGNISISIGYTRASETDYPRTVLEQADKALYYAKEMGKGRIINYQKLVEDGVYKEESKAGSSELF